MVSLILEWYSQTATLAITESKSSSNIAISEGLGSPLYYYLVVVKTFFNYQFSLSLVLSLSFSLSRVSQFLLSDPISVVFCFISNKQSLKSETHRKKTSDRHPGIVSSLTMMLKGLTAWVVITSACAKHFLVQIKGK